MFMMTLSDEDPTNTIKAMCFCESLYDKFEVMKTHTIEQFKIKKSFGYDSCPIQIVIDTEAKVELSLRQFEVERKIFTQIDEK